MNLAELPITFDRECLASFCRERGICKPTWFGSARREALTLYKQAAETPVPGLIETVDPMLEELGAREAH